MNQNRAEFWSIIPAGGAGTRLWPVSRADHPKFLLALTGQRSLIQQTYDRLLLLSPPERILIVAGSAHVAEISRQLPDLPPENIIVEPSPKGTGPAIGLASLLIADRCPDAIIGSFAADHEVADLDGFVSAVNTARTAATQSWLVTIGIMPTRAATGYGYIERTDNLVVELPFGIAYQADAFVEKPDASTAQSFLDSGRYLWNASMFIWTARDIAEAFRTHQHATYRQLLRMVKSDNGETSARCWSAIQTDTIDQSIMERVDRFAVVPAEFGWSDIGDWDTLGSIINSDGDGNASNADVIAVDTTNCVFWSETGRQIAVAGLDDVAIVDTPDALLVLKRSRAQEVREIVEELKRNRSDLC